MYWLLWTFFTISSVLQPPRQCRVPAGHTIVGLYVRLDYCERRSLPPSNYWCRLVSFVYSVVGHPFFDVNVRLGCCERNFMYLLFDHKIITVNIAVDCFELCFLRPFCMLSTVFSTMSTIWVSAPSLSIYISYFPPFYFVFKGSNSVYYYQIHV